MNKLHLNFHVMIFPSKFEPFGIRLIEVKKNYLKAITSELDYVRNVIDPEYIFNPESPNPIFRSIKRNLQINEGKIHIYFARDFLKKINIF